MTDENPFLPNDYQNNTFLDESLQTLNSFNEYPFVDRFMRNFGFNEPELNQKSQKIQRISSEISSPGDPSLKDLVDYLDELKFFGKQRIFLYSLKGEHVNYLDDLNDTQHIKKQIAEHEQQDVFNNGKLVWRASEPQLAEVKHHYENGRGKLIFKWIQTRYYIQDGGFPVITGSERSGSYFVVDLENGEAEIRIQSLKSKSLVSIRQQFDLYVEEIKKYINLDKFNPLNLEPLINKYLVKPIDHITRYRAKNKELRANISGSKPSALAKLVLPLQSFFGQELTLKWKCQQITQGQEFLFYTLNGNHNEVEFNAKTDKSKVDFLLSRIREQADYTFELKELKELAQEHPDLENIIIVLDHYIGKLKQVKISTEHLQRDFWIPEDKSIDVFKLIASRYPEKFTIDDENYLIYNFRFNLNEGLLDYGRQRGQIKKNGAYASNTASFALTIFNAVIELIESWIREKIYDVLIPWPPFIIAQFIVLFLSAIVIFGFKRVWQKTFLGLANLFYLIFFGRTESHNVTRLFNTYYSRWIAKRKKDYRFEFEDDLQENGDEEEPDDTDEDDSDESEENADKE